MVRSIFSVFNESYDIQGEERFEKTSSNEVNDVKVGLKNDSPEQECKDDESMIYVPYSLDVDKSQRSSQIMATYLENLPKHIFLNILS